MFFLFYKNVLLNFIKLKMTIYFFHHLDLLEIAQR